MKTLLMIIPLALVVALLSSAAAGQAPASRGPVTIGYVSAQRIFAEATDAKAEVARMQAVQQQKTSDLRTKQQALETTRQQLAGASDGPTRVQLQQQELQQRTDFERSTVQAQADIQAAQRQMQANVQGRVKTVLDEVAKAQNLLVVVNADAALVWAAPGLDLTPAVIERMNKAAAKP
jgi:Skp family chaperone for outer membrane proteins